MLIENALSDAVRLLSSAVGLKMDFDMALLVIASGMCRLLSRRMRTTDAQARHIFRELIGTPADMMGSECEIHVHFHQLAACKFRLAARPGYTRQRADIHQCLSKN